MMAEQTRFKGKFVRKSKLNQLKGLLKEKTDESHEKEVKVVEGKIADTGHTGDDGLHPDKDGVEAKVQAVVTGRRVVDVAFLASQLFCSCCNSPIQLCDITSETRRGLASVFSVACNSCQFVSMVSTSRRHRGPKGPYDVNTKLALGAIESGCGWTHAAGLLSAMNIPSMHHKSMKERENEIGAAIQDLAKETCNEAMEEEIALAQNDSAAEDDEPTPVSVSFDAGWSTRGSGRSYNSDTGHSALIGSKSGKCLAFSVKTRRCRVCETAEKENKEAKKHQCYRNWDKSSKSMEPAMGLELVEQLQDSELCRVSTITMDNDATTMAHINSKYPNIKKNSDKNHTKKSISNTLYGLQAQHKILKNTKVLKYICKMFRYAMEQSQGDPEQLRSRLSQVVPHMYGEHEHCQDWCAHRSNEVPYRDLPYKKALSDSSLRNSLEKMVNNYKEKAEKLAHLGSSQANEALNLTVSSKANKSRAYGHSGSIVHRVSAAIAQKNIGRSWVSKAASRIGLSPGTYSQKHADLLDRKRKRNKDLETSRESKRRRLALKGRRMNQALSAETREGDSYSPNIDISANSVDFMQVPPPILVRSTSEVNPVIFDLETTSLSRTSDIVQISAIATLSGATFNRYIMPTQPISKQASAVTKLCVRNGALEYNGSEVQCTDKAVALQDFSNFVQSVSPAVLVGHNINSFDVPVLHHHLCNQNVNLSVKGCLDTYLLCHKLFKKSEFGNFKQETLVQKFCKKDYCAHNALEDVKALSEVYDQKISPLLTPAILSENMFTFDSYVCRSSFSEMQKSKAVSVLTVRKMSRSGLCFAHLQHLFTKGGRPAIASVLGESVGGKHTRVSNSDAVIDKIVSYFESKAATN